MRTKFAENFTDILRIRNISQSQFARLYGVKPNTINQWANGKREPTYHDLMCICTLLNVEVTELLGFNALTKQLVLRDIILRSEEFQKEQQTLQMQMYKSGKSDIEIIKACEELYQKKYEEYNKVFHFNIG